VQQHPWYHLDVGYRLPQHTEHVLHRVEDALALVGLTIVASVENTILMTRRHRRIAYMQQKSIHILLESGWIRGCTHGVWGGSWQLYHSDTIDQNPDGVGNLVSKLEFIHEQSNDIFFFFLLTYTHTFTKGGMRGTAIASYVAFT